MPVPSYRTWVLVDTDDGLTGPSISMRVGESKVFALDFRNDLATNGRLTDFTSIAIDTGTAGGVTFDADLGVDRTQAKVEITAVTAGTYVLEGSATYMDADGGGTSIGSVTLVVGA